MQWVSLAPPNPWSLATTALPGEIIGDFMVVDRDEDGRRTADVGQ
ncbi:MAG: hypothetical protein R3C28_13135 [Pirellulaceae bacterium]